MGRLRARGASRSQGSVPGVESATQMLPSVPTSSPRYAGLREGMAAPVQVHDGLLRFIIHSTDSRRSCASALETGTRSWSRSMRTGRAAPVM